MDGVNKRKWWECLSLLSLSFSSFRSQLEKSFVIDGSSNGLGWISLSLFLSLSLSIIRERKQRH